MTDKAKRIKYQYVPEFAFGMKTIWLIPLPKIAPEKLDIRTLGQLKKLKDLP